MPTLEVCAMRILGLVMIAVVLAACASGGGTAPASSSLPSAPATQGSVPPAQVGPDALAALQAYGAEHADEFGGMYIDPPGGASVVLLFTANLEAHGAALARIHPSVRVRQVEHTEAELVELLESLDVDRLRADGIEVIAGAVDVRTNRVTLEAKSNDPTAELRLEAAHLGMLDVTIHPLPGPWANAEAGDGWRLLAAGQVGHDEAYRVRAATGAGAWSELWDAVGLGGPKPDVDLEREVVASFGHGIGSSCPERRLDDVVVRDGIVYSVTSDPLEPRACTADLVGAAAFVVAIERDLLPGDGFVLQLSETSVTCGPDCGFSEQIEVRLP